MTDHEQLPRFDAGNWVLVARLTVTASVALSVVTIAILVLADPPNQCPNWHLKNAHSTSLWHDVIILAAPLNILCCFIAIRWNWVVRKGIESEGRGLLFGRVAPPAILPTHILAHMCVVMSLVSQFP